MRSAARLPRAAVVVALALAASTVLVAAAAPMHHARAEADQVLLGLGARVMAFPDATLEEPRSIRLNGIDLLFRSQSVDASVKRCWVTTAVAASTQENQHRCWHPF